MLAIVWNPNDFHFINAMLKWEKNGSRSYLDNVLTPVCQRLIPTGKHQLILYVDNSRCHTANVVLDFVSQRKIKISPHLPYFPDIAPSDFFLFRT
jgi:hypothetical protein